LRAKAENLQQQQQQQQMQDHDERTTVELSTEHDVSKPSESVEQSTASVKEQMSEVAAIAQPTEADEDTSENTAGDKVSTPAVSSEPVVAEVTAEVIPDSRVEEDVEANEKPPEINNRKTQSAVTESATELQSTESSEKPENLENAAGDSTVVKEAFPVVVVAPSDREVGQTTDVSTQFEPSQPDSQSYTAENQYISAGVETGREEPSESSATLPSEQSITDIDKTKLEIVDDIMRSVSDESSDAYTDVLEDETDHLSDILEGQDKVKRKEDIEYVELCDESSSTVEPNTNKEDNKEETEKELDSILDDVHLDESEHGNCRYTIFFSFFTRDSIQGESKKVDPLRVLSIFSLGLSLFV